MGLLLIGLQLGGLRLGMGLLSTGLLLGIGCACRRKRRSSGGVGQSSGQASFP